MIMGKHRWDDTANQDQWGAATLLARRHDSEGHPATDSVASSGEEKERRSAPVAADERSHER